MQPKHNVEIWGRGKKPHASMQWGGAAALPHFWVENKCVHTYHVHPDGAKIEPQFKGEKHGFCAGAAMQNDIKRFFRNPLIFDGVFSEAVFFHVFMFLRLYCFMLSFSAGFFIRMRRHIQFIAPNFSVGHNRVQLFRLRA